MYYSCVNSTNIYMFFIRMLVYAMCIVVEISWSENEIRLRERVMCSFIKVTKRTSTPIL